MGSLFYGSIKRGRVIPIHLTLPSTPDSTPTYRILLNRVEIVAATSLSGSGQTWYKDDETVSSTAAEGEYIVEFTYVISGSTGYITDGYEVPVSGTTPASYVAPSGSSNWTLTRDNIIKSALFTAGVIGEGQEPNANQIAKVSDMLNQYVKRLQSRHTVKFWTLEWAQKKFSAPSEVTVSSVNYTCIDSHTSSSDDEPGVGDNWSTRWIVMGSSGSAWVTSTGYTSAGDFTEATDMIGIESAFLRRESTTGPHSESIIDVIGNAEYASITNKTSFGDPISIHFDNRLSPTSYLYPQLEDTDDIVLHYQKIMRIEDFDAAGDYPDFPVDWLDHIVSKMTHKVSMAWHMPISEQREYKREAEEALADVLYGGMKRGKIMKVQVRGYTK